MGDRTEDDSKDSSKTNETVWADDCSEIVEVSSEWRMTKEGDNWSVDSRDVARVGVAGALCCSVSDKGEMSVSASGSFARMNGVSGIGGKGA